MLDMPTSFHSVMLMYTIQLIYLLVHLAVAAHRRKREGIPALVEAAGAEVMAALVAPACLLVPVVLRPQQILTYRDMAAVLEVFGIQHRAVVLL